MKFNKREFIASCIVIIISSVISISITSMLSKRNIEQTNDRLTDIEYRQDGLDYIYKELKGVIYDIKNR